MTEQLNLMSPVDVLNSLLGPYWSGSAQHQTHAAMIEGWGLAGLAEEMRTRIADEPVTISALTNRILDLGGTPAISFPPVNIGGDLRQVLENDMDLQRSVRTDLNKIVEQIAAAHDATTRTLIEGILADEEEHLVWLETNSACSIA
jgi:bacterioferritin